MPVLNAEGLRPTPARTRDRLFNWLAPHLSGAVVLDLFAGSGVLGMEACSLSAKACTFVEQNPQVAAHIKQSCADFRLKHAKVVCMDARRWLAQAAQQPLFDVVFVDPPFALNVLPLVLDALPKHLNDGAWVYVESGSNQMLPHEQQPELWEAHREGKSSETHYALYRWAKEQLQ